MIFMQSTNTADKTENKFDDFKLLESTFFPLSPHKKTTFF